METYCNRYVSMKYDLWIGRVHGKRKESLGFKSFCTIKSKTTLMFNFNFLLNCTKQIIWVYPANTLFDSLVVRNYVNYLHLFYSHSFHYPLSHQRFHCFFILNERGIIVRNANKNQQNFVNQSIKSTSTSIRQVLSFYSSVFKSNFLY